VLPDHAEDKLRDPKYRKETLIPHVDGILVAQSPQTALIPPGIRRAVIERILTLLIDDILIPESEHSKSLAADEDPVLVAAVAAAELPEILPLDIGLGVRGITLEAPAADPLDLQSQAQAHLGEAWAFAPLSGLAGFYHLTAPSESRPTVGEAWEMTRRLGALPHVVYAEPSIYQLHGAADIATTAMGSAPVAAAAGLSSWGSQDHNVKETETEPEWSLTRTHAKALWGNHKGEGILIGHIDTGYSHHPEVLPNIDTASGYDTWENDPNAEDDLDPSIWDRLSTNLIVPPQPGHGTSTGSVIASPEGKQPGHNSTYGVTGTAPRATIVPIRATPTVVILPTGSQDEVAAGILAAVARGVHVISMSLGSPWNARPLEAAVRRALDAGVIVCAAAGNVVLKETWFTGVMYPAAFPGVIAVAACDYHRRPWRDGCRGDRVTVTAPGTDVWRAKATRKGFLFKKTVLTVDRGSGTSYAVATTAGIAACWLRHWTGHYGGRAAFIQHLGGQASAIPTAFAECLRQHQATTMVFPNPAPADLPGYKPEDYPASHYGVGIINAEELLKITPTAPLAAPAIAAAAAATGSGGGVILAELARATRHNIHDLRRALAAELGLDSAALDAHLANYGREMLHYFATSAALRQRLDSLMAPQAPASAAAAFAAAPPVSLGRQLRALASPSLAAALPQ
jgi:thermitase